MGETLENYVRMPLVEGNTFKSLPLKTETLPTYEEGKGALPRPHWPNNPDAIRCYDKVWSLAFKNLKNPLPGTGYITPFIDTAFSKEIFMWDSSFILMFARYGQRAFNFQQTLDNFYACQHPDGYICRQINFLDGVERFRRHDPSSTGPNIMPWCEWEYFRNMGDLERLKKVLVPLLAYHRWMRSYRCWQDGSYWSSGWGCGMDNQPRLPEGCDHAFQHGFMGWVDATAQALLSTRHLQAMAKATGYSGDISDLAREEEHLTGYLNRFMWNPELGFYTDRMRGGECSRVIGVAGFWPLLCGLPDTERLTSLLDYLEDERHFNRPHRVPTLSHSHADYRADGGYWLGGVWAPTNYMVLRGLRHVGTERANRLAREIGRNHVDCITEVFRETGTVWENYAPETMSPGKPAKADFVGWSGLGPVAVLLEEVFGFQPDVPANRLVWDLSLTDEHGVDQYPFGTAGLLSLHAQSRASADEKPQITVSSNTALTLELRWKGGREIRDIQPNR